MGMYQVDITTDVDIVSVIVNANDESEAIAIALTMFEQEEILSGGSVALNATAFLA